MPTTISQALSAATQTLEAAGVPEPRVDAELIFAFVLNESRGRVQALDVAGGAVTDGALEAIDAFILRRANREPLQHITGLAPFRRLELVVGPGVFIPRPETEWVTQLAIDALAQHTNRAGEERVAVDFCTGSAAIALSIATEVEDVRVWAVEKSQEAFAWALKNRARVGASNLTLENVEVEGSLTQLDGKVDVVVSNPPYIPLDAVPKDPEVQKFDPALALYGGADGLEVVRQVSANAHRLLKPGGRLVIEHGELQGAEIREILVSDGFSAAETLQDFTRRDRATTAVR